MNSLAEKIKSIDIEKEPPQERDYIGASQVGNPCLRYIWYEWKKEKGIQESSLQKRILATGKHFESLALEWIKEALAPEGISIKDGVELFDKDIPLFRGTPDFIAMKPDGTQFIIEIKTTNHSNFQQFMRTGLKKWMVKYYYQLQAYMGMSGIHESHLLAMDKDTSELHSEEVLFDGDHYEFLKTRVQAVLSADSPPPQMHHSPMFYLCRCCPYRDPCHIRDN